jgi:hypoxanthine-guanine phosphoribosyltransferase
MSSYNIHDDIGEVLWTQEEISSKIKELGRQVAL